MRLAEFHTTRLVVRHWADDLADPSDRAWVERGVKALLTPSVLSPLPPSMQLGDTPAALSHWIDHRAEESDVYLISIRAPETGSGRLIGLMILVDLTGDDQLAQMHLGYLLAEQDWGQGYATEMLTGLVKVLQEFAPLSVVAGVGHDNPVSAHVLEKAGFRNNPALSCDDTDMFVQVFA